MTAQTAERPEVVRLLDLTHDHTRDMLLAGVEPGEELLRKYVKVAEEPYIDVTMWDIKMTHELGVPRQVVKIYKGAITYEYRGARGEGGAATESVGVLYDNGFRDPKLNPYELFHNRFPPILGVLAYFVTQMKPTLLLDLNIEDRHDTLAEFRRRGVNWTIDFYKWFKDLRPTIVLTDLACLGVAVELFARREQHKTMRSNPKVDIRLWEGRGDFVEIFDPEYYSRPGEVVASFKRADGTFARGPSKEIEGLAAPASLVTALLRKVANEVLIDLSMTFGTEDPFRQVRERGAEWAAGFTAYLSSRGAAINSLSSWEGALQGYDQILKGGLCVARGVSGESEWVIDAISHIVKNPVERAATHLGAAIVRRHRGAGAAFDGVEIEEFARNSLPANSRVRAVKVLRDGKIRITLSEPIRAFIVVRLGRTYIEDPVGATLSDMVVAAFDLDFRNHQGGFPNAIAYADPGCTRRARHTNISPDRGAVCLGNLNGHMTTAEMEARGSQIDMPSLADFIQMLTQCNLDSAYRGGRDFLLREPSSVTEEEYMSREAWSIPGLRLVESSISELRGIVRPVSVRPPGSARLVQSGGDVT